MKEYKFKNFDFEGFMNFVLNLVDYYKLEEIRFFPDKKEIFNDFQLCHISPSRSVNDKNGFTRAWMDNKNKVREVSFDQFSKDNLKKIKLTINLDKETIKFDSISGISEKIIEGLIEEQFGEVFDISDIKREQLELRLSSIEFLFVLLFTIIFSFIFYNNREPLINFDWKLFLKYFVPSLGFMLIAVYLILPIIGIARKVGLNIKDVFWEFKAEFNRKTKLGKTKTFLAIILGMIAFYKFFKDFI